MTCFLFGDRPLPSGYIQVYITIGKKSGPRRTHTLSAEALCGQRAPFRLGSLGACSWPQLHYVRRARPRDARPVINVLNSPIPDVDNAVTVDWFRSSSHRKTISPWGSGVVL
jgi:hypothetical protein